MTAIRRIGVIASLVIALASPALPVLAASPASQRTDADGWAARSIDDGGTRQRDRAKASQLPGTAKLGYHPGTGRVRFISGTPQRPLSDGLVSVTSGRGVLTAADARRVARRFLDGYGSLFGLAEPRRELRLRGTRRTLALPAGADGSPRGRVAAGLPNVVVRFAQVRDGIEVMGGELVVQLGSEGEVISVAGEILPSGAATATRALVPAWRARRTAATWLARQAGRAARAVATSSEGLAQYDPRIMDDPSLADIGRRLVWRIDARLPDVARRSGLHRLVLVDARSGSVLTSIERRPTVDRRVCDNRSRRFRSFRCRAPYRRSEGQPATGVRDVDAVYRFMGVTYDYFRDRFGRDGINGQGARLMATVRYCGVSCPWQNAEWKWDAQQAVFGRGWARADDIVAHELTHGLLDHEAPLFYHYQSGAINESIADVFGELIDLANPGSRDTARNRWKIGEDTPRGAFRDMRYPPRFGHPDRVRSPRWHTGPSDNGGVHRNSGVGNKAAYLMAAGGTFRGHTIEAIGRERTARVWYQALTTRLTSAANYIDLFDALNAACTDLAGTDGLTLAHCRSVRKATLATQMHKQPRLLGPKSAPVCERGTSPLDVLNDDLEDPDAGIWTSMRLVGSERGWYYPQNPNNVPGWDGSWSSSGRLNFYAPDRGTRSDTVMRMRAPVLLPEGAYLRFEHGYSFDKDARRRFDGGLVELKVDGGPWRGVDGLFTHGGYNGRIARGFGNPLKGRKAFTGSSRGWSQTRIDLSGFAGSQVKVRFRMGSDRKVGARGWYVDDIRIYACADDHEPPTGTLTIDGGEPTTSVAAVALALTWDDAGSWVTRLRLSGSPQTNSNGVLRQGVSMPVRDAVAWDLADTTYGGSGAPGTRTVYAQVRDAAGNWSAVFSDEIELLP